MEILPNLTAVVVGLTALAAALKTLHREVAPICKVLKEDVGDAAQSVGEWLRRWRRSPSTTRCKGSRGSRSTSQLANRWRSMIVPAATILAVILLVGNVRANWKEQGIARQSEVLKGEELTRSKLVPKLLKFVDSYEKTCNDMQELVTHLSSGGNVPVQFKKAESGDYTDIDAKEEFLEKFKSLRKERGGSNRVLIEGFADDTGAPAYNRMVTQARVEAVADVLQRVDKDLKLYKISYGSSRADDPDLNRRFARVSFINP